MIRSLYSAISGLRNHQTRMDVIGNNIANVNTIGYKRSRVSFASELSQTMKGASAPSPVQGGTNAMQVGMGMRIGAIDQIITQGSSQSTGNPTDMMLQGAGFFVLNNNGQQIYTRAGGFSLDSDGILIDPATGAKVQGYSWGIDDSTPVNWGAISDIRFKIGDILASDSGMPIATTEVLLNDATVGFNAEVAGFPASYVDNVGLKGAANVTIDGMTMVPLTTTPTTGQFTFDPISGTITFAKGFVAPTAPDGLNMSYVPAANMDTATISGNTAIVDYPPKPGAIVYNDAGASGTFVPYTLATSDIPGNGEYVVNYVNGQYQITFGAKQADGSTDTTLTKPISYDFINKPHTLTDFSIDQSGVITGVYSNGVDTVTHKIAQVAIATFANEAGLQNVGGSFYTTSNNSGLPNIGAAGEDGRASIIPNSVEMSNVDLSTEFTDMIVTQRGFQANSRVITVSDTLLEELINLKR
ncbi:MAG: flagellar hook protein FlgE [Desulfosporosinus sp.]|jgi:flagellar hook protein FlgE